MYMHALHTVHALPDLRVAAGRLRDAPRRKMLERQSQIELTATAVTQGRAQHHLGAIRARAYR
jgi:hypothetical protein